VQLISYVISIVIFNALNENWGKFSMQNNVADFYAPFYGYVSQ
jgi:hypothetical protein